MPQTIHHTDHAPLTAEKIDQLCERLNATPATPGKLDGFRWEVTHCVKSLEEDSFEHGCDPTTGQEYPLPEMFYASKPTIKELMDELWKWIPFKRDDEAVEYDSCEEDGRIDIQGMEDADSNEPTERQMEEWKAGRLKLWAVTYHFWIVQVERRTHAITRLPGTCPECSDVLTHPREEDAGRYGPNYCLTCDREVDEKEVIRPWQG